MLTFTGILFSVLAVSTAILLVIYVVVPVFSGIGWFIRHIARYVAGTVGDVLRAIGALMTSLLLIPLIAGAIIIGRWSAASHYGREYQREIGRCGRCIYRILIGRPARLLGLGALTEGIERRIPDAVAHAPGADKPSRRTGRFEGYTIVGSLAGGGSGARIYIAEPDQKKRAAFERAGRRDIDQVVIKSFSVKDGSSLPQIVRESRALEAARNLGLVLDHELNEHRFHYVMPYVPGESLAVATRRLHDSAGATGLSRRELDETLAWATDLLQTLVRYHEGGLWHKDVKPDNIIVHRGQAHLVDLGLVTPMSSAMTLTTHGTEYFRDPEMVRMALRGVKVHEVDGAKFDVYAAGAVLYSIVENSFPAHGGLSQVTKRCPDALRFVIRRAMSDYTTRYHSASAMLEDLRALKNASDPSALKPADLPSMRGRPVAVEVAAMSATPGQFTPPDQPASRPEQAAPAFDHAAPPPLPPRRRPQLRITSWVAGAYAPDDSIMAGATAPGVDEPGGSAVSRSPRPPRKNRPSAPEQLHRARARARAAQERAQRRMRTRHLSSARYNSNPNSGVIVAAFLFTALFIGGAIVVAVALAAKGGSVSDSIQSHIRESRTLGIQRRAETASRDIGQAVFTVDREKILFAVDSLVEAMGSVDELTLSSAGPKIRTALAEVSRTARAIASAVAIPPAAPAPAGSFLGEVLLIDDLGSAASDARAEALRTINTNFSSGRVRILSAESDDSILELEANARKDIGAIPTAPFDDQLREKAIQWLRNQRESIQAVIVLHWVGQGESQTPVSEIIARPGTDGAWLHHQISAGSR